MQLHTNIEWVLNNAGIKFPQGDSYSYDPGRR
jgi:hypothetical protein